MSSTPSSDRYRSGRAASAGRVDRGRVTDAGKAVYNPVVLALYDAWVLGLTNSYIWRCPSTRILDLYDRNVSDCHLDVGVGTGWYLDRCRFPVAEPRITLFDLNRNSLDHCATRIARYRPTSVYGDVLEPFELPRHQFGSIAVNYLLHCLPAVVPSGSLPLGKWSIFNNLTATLRSDGVLFGATVLGAGAATNWVQRGLMNLYNQRGIFGNITDSREALERGLEASFRDVTIEVEGVVALFRASDKRV